MVHRRNFVFSTDSYHENSIKAQERYRRGNGEQFVFKGPATVRPADFKQFLSNNVNKKNFCKLLLSVWSSKQAATRLKKCNIAILVVDGVAYQLQSDFYEEVTITEIHQLLSNQ